jgi:hypothetical protein
MKYFYLALFCLSVLFSPGCTRHTIESKNDITLQPVEIKPIHITIDVNIKVDRALDDFFGDIDAAR